MTTSRLSNQFNSFNSLAEAQASRDAQAAVAETESSASSVVTIVRPAKQSHTLDVPAGTTVEGCLDIIGTTTADLTLTLRGSNGPGTTAVTGDYKIPAGEWTLFCSPKVAGGM
jgi:hypothetical protein